MESHFADGPRSKVWNFLAAFQYLFCFPYSKEFFSIILVFDFESQMQNLLDLDILVDGIFKILGEKNSTMTKTPCSKIHSQYFIIFLYVTFSIALFVNVKMCRYMHISLVTL